MTWERLLLRLVPAFLVIAGLAVPFVADTAHSNILGLGAIALSVLMTGALFFYELEIRRSEDRLRERAETSGEGAPAAGGPAVWRSHPSHEKPDFANVSVKDLSMRFVDMTDASFAGASLRHCDLSDAQLSHADFSSAFLSADQFVNSNLRSVRMRSAEVQECAFLGAALESSDWSEASMKGVDFTKANAARAKFVEARMTSCSFQSSAMKEADFSNAILNDCSLADAKFSGSDFSHASFVATDLTAFDFKTVVIDHTSIDPRSLPHGQLIFSLLTLLSGQHAGWVVIDSVAGYVQAFREGEQIRCEAVNFDSWPGWRDSRKMTPDMIRKLEKLGFKQRDGDNFFYCVRFDRQEDLRKSAGSLEDVLHDVYGISMDAPLEVTVGGLQNDESALLTT